VALYDEYLYDELSLPFTHPDHLATIARLFGMRPAPPEGCRVLELGCGLGGNLVPMACGLPGSVFVGVDQSARQIAVGQADVDALGLGNLTLRAMDILDVDASLGSFDYIVCHGVYSWVPAEVRAKILRVCATQLAPQGVAYISFNTYPGWHLRGMIRDMLRREVGADGTPAERVARARAFLAFLALAPPEENTARAWLHGELELLGQLSDKYLFYEHLVDENTPVYFAEFAAAANRVGLQYLGDAHFPSMAPDRFGPEVTAAIDHRSVGVVDTEQHLDLIALRYFRCALLCHDAVDVQRALAASRLEDLRVSSSFSPASASPDLGPDVAEAFHRPGGAELSTSQPLLKAALVALAEERPRGLAFPALCARVAARFGDGPLTPGDRDVLGDNLLGLFVRGHLELGVWDRPLVKRSGPHPTTTALTRLQARSGRASCTALHHGSVSMDRLDRSLLKRMDGTSTVADLVRGVRADLEAGALAIEADGEPVRDEDVLREIVDVRLGTLGQRGLLIG
jgi:SAM-dependent methyltransferase